MPSEDLKPNLPRPVHTFETEDFKMAWDRNFRDMLRAHPGIIKTAIAITDQAVAQYNPGNNPIPDYDAKVMFDRENGKWLEEKIIMRQKNNDEESDYDPVTGKLATQSRGWVDLTVGRGAILVPGESIKDDKTGLEIVVLGRSNRELPMPGFTRVDRCDYLKMSFRGQSFFVKRCFITNNPGFFEFKNTISAKEALKDLDFVRVVDAKLGYQDKNESWYISGWEELERAGFQTFDYSISRTDYGSKKKESIQAWLNLSEDEFTTKEDEYSKAEAKAKLISEKLELCGINYDLYSNLFYNYQTKTFVLLDVTGNQTEYLGNAIIEG